MTGSMPSVAVIGAGFGGLAAAIELDRNGIHTYEVFERGDSVGGVWRANSYPGAACDVPSPTYCFSYALEPEWSARYGSQPEIHAYLRRCADRFGITPKIRFGTEVVAATFRDEGRWVVEFADGRTKEFDALICATGQLSRPRIPNLDGLADFAGAQFHSAEWDHSVELAGKRVAVVGSGASAIQLVPAIVDRVALMHVVQRSPNWVANKYNHRGTGLAHRLAHRLPGMARLEHNVEWLWYEMRVPMIFNAADPLRALYHALLRAKIRREIKDPALRAAVTPDYKIGCNRVLLSTDWYPALDRPHVRVHTEGVRRVTPTGLVLADGTAIDVDVIVWCTGFTPNEYLAPIDITGRDGRKLHTEWKRGPQAYLGISASGYPNLFMMYGPNTGSLTNTITFLLEKQARYTRLALQHLARTGGWLDVRPDVQDRFNAKLQRRLRNTVFTSGCPGWYHTEEGKVFAVWPGSHVAYAAATRTFDPACYEHGGLRK
ncbi:flavin-containing monooxygenase [Nocardia iowensis]|uniref:NAD(P)/FAD-dependent oxidoreductase n=1 Tax=Nocardia iowensis TaxID=204891 RepID=A0ABX8RHR4_NOCIO|nr:NAD(P)/FAD-dependent oxidoreductase [Nocardia iowensis]QXN88427.1 NAD(P)/FAD-dependent oxidoreductase [Nocardia iowensis]